MQILSFGLVVTKKICKAESPPLLAHLVITTTLTERQCNFNTPEKANMVRVLSYTIE